MSEAKAEILRRVRASLADSPEAPEVTRAYRTESEKSAQDVRAMLVDRLLDYKANVYEETT
ncbi:MAG: lactate utilization protein C, partial [Kocuria sp.]|nr:lactate utilization protein C [Kocuria sp.]